MPVLSSAAWVAHDVGLAAAIGGSLYGKTAMHPALRQLPDPDLRDQVADVAWRRFSWWNLAAHAVVAGTWLVGRSILSGREAGPEARTLTLVKDVCVATSVVTGLASVVLGRWLGRKTARQQGPQRAHEGGERAALRIERVLNAVGDLNLAANVGALGTTALLAMQGSESPRFAITSRRLP